MYSWAKLYSNGMEYDPSDEFHDDIIRAWSICGLYVKQVRGEECEPPPAVVEGYNLLFTPTISPGESLTSLIGTYEKFRQCPTTPLDANGNYTYVTHTTKPPLEISSSDFSIVSVNECKESYEDSTRCTVSTCNIIGNFHPNGPFDEGINIIYSEYLYFLHNWETFFGTVSQKIRFQLEGFVQKIVSPPSFPPKMEMADLPQEPIQCPLHKKGSIIEVDNQVIGESVAITGTAYSLYYFSNRVPGRLDQYKLHIPLIRGKVPSNLTSIEMTNLFAGRDLVKTFTPEDNLSYDFFWDGLDSSGKLAIGSTEVVISITNKGPGGSTISNSVQRLGGWSVRPLGLNGWIFDSVNFYDKGSKILYFGKGGSISNTGVPYQGGFAAPSSDGNELYIFDISGRHIKTLNALTGDLKLKINYSPLGGIVSLLDAYNNKTIVEHLDTHAVKIIAPNGQVTLLDIDQNGWLSKIQNPANETYSMTYKGRGLLVSFVKPGGQATTISYDALGFLIKDQNSAGSFLSLFKSQTPDGWLINTETAEGRKNSFELKPDVSGFSRVFTDARTMQEKTTTTKIGESENTTVEGFVSRVVTEPDLRFKDMAPIDARITKSILESEFNYVEENSRIYEFYDNDPFKLKTVVSKKTILGEETKILLSSFNNGDRINSETSAEGRKILRVLNFKGEIGSIKIGNLLPIESVYNEKGRLVRLSQGDRETKFSYDIFGFYHK